ncbi:MAG: hypothetical protein HY904_22980 [Deltaproteobacteria bacterium]|nr:hypothetical protein [Deltaproteobacteria bacterium]
MDADDAAVLADAPVDDAGAELAPLEPDPNLDADKPAAEVVPALEPGWCKVFCV